MTVTQLDQLSINTIRFLAVDAVQKANSGHPGMPMGAAPAGYALWTRHMCYNPANPSWPNRDRFVLSAGHGSMLLDALLYLTGYKDMTLEEIKNFRQWGSRAAGHPEYGEAGGIETTTGPLGQGLANAVGMALAEAYLAKHFNREGYNIVDHHTYVMAGDGDMMEGVAIEAASLAGHWALGKLIVLYDDNQITLDGEARMTMTEDVLARFAAQGWHTERIADGNDVDAIDQAIANAKAVTNQPSIIAIRTVIGFGSPKYAGSSEAHGKALGTDEVRATKQNLGWPLEPDFYVPDEVRAHFNAIAKSGAEKEVAWQATFDSWRKAYPELAAEWDRAFSGELPEGWDSTLPQFDPAKPVATRSAGGTVLNAIAAHIPTMIGGDADLAGSTKTLIKGAANTGPGNPAERNIRFGVREHAMGAITNGLALHGGIIRPYTATFLTFSDYMRPAIRLGALMRIPVVYVFTHDSIGVGEDGPTHQPVEQIMALRAIPHLTVVRPADAYETVGAWKQAMLQTAGPTVLVFSRQDLPVLTPDSVANVARGAYIVRDVQGKPDLILIGTGSEVHLAIAGAEALAAEGIKARVVSMPSWELFEAQPQAYRDSVLPPDGPPRLAIEAGVTLGWHKYTGDRGGVIGLDRFGASAPGEVVMDKLGFNVPNVVARAKALLKN